MTAVDKRLDGYSQWEGVDAFEDFVGPLYYKEVDGENRCAFVVTENHVNGQQGLHGGMLMTFADYALFMFARKQLEGQRAVTVTFNSQFTAVSRLGDFVESTGEIVHETRKMLFLRGTVFTSDTILLNFSAVLKKTGPRKDPLYTK